MSFQERARGFISYVNASPSPFHAVAAAKELLVEAGFVELSEKADWDVSPLGKYFFTRNQSTLVAFAVGGKYKKGNGFTVIGAHTDSPCLRVKPNSKLNKAGYLSVGVECYGGGLWHTWFDRDLSIAGRAMVRRDDGTVAHKLLRVDDPILRVPNLAIHLNRSVNTEGFKLNKETHLVPALGLAAEQLNSPSERQAADAPDTKKPKLKKPHNQASKHHSKLIEIISSQLGCAPEAVLDFELSLFDTQPSCIGGAHEEFIFSPRLDNLESSYCGLMGLIESSNNEAGLASDENIRLLSLFDHEEVGSNSAQGAGSALFGHVLKRLAGDEFEKAVPKSFIVSADMAHAIHPNYQEKHEANHKPLMNKGPVIKFNANQRYATNAVTATILREVADIADVPLQDVMVRNDSACGSTIGPILSAGLGIRTIDIGNAQLSMHSIREMGGSKDIKYSIDLFNAVYTHFVSVDGKIAVE